MWGLWGIWGFLEQSGEGIEDPPVIRNPDDRADLRLPAIFLANHAPTKFGAGSTSINPKHLVFRPYFS